MVMQIVCSCGRKLQTRIGLPGQTCICPVCKQTLVIPEDSTASLPPPTHPESAPAIQKLPSAPAPPESFPHIEPEPLTALIPEWTLGLNEEPAIPPLETPTSVGFATLLAGVAGGSYVLAINEWHLRRRLRAILFGILGTAFNVILLLALALATRTEQFSAWFLLSVLVWCLAVPLLSLTATMLYQPEYQRQPSLSFLAAVGSVFHLTAGLMASNILLFVFATDRYHHHLAIRDYQPINYGSERILYYSADIQPTTANRLGEALTQAGYFSHRFRTDKKGSKTEEKSVRLRLLEGDYVLDFIVPDSTWTEDVIVQYFRDLGGHLSTQVFRGSSLRIHLCNSYFEERAVVMISASTRPRD